MKNEKPLVSIYCLTYNHEPYIRDCLDGFLMQKTDFAFEVIVHDDASTDRTQDIIREYEEKYPGIIRPIYQAVNQYRLNVPMVTKFVFPKVSGKYVAICEGDDYWTDPEKLQRQVKMLEEHPECHFCVCGVEEVSVNKTPLGYCHPNFQIEDEFIESDNFIEYAAKYAFQTSSYLMRYNDWAEYITNPPEFKKTSNMGDITMLLYFGCMGKTVYINRIMSCYRRGGASSFSSDRNRWPEEKRKIHFEKQMKVWSLFDEYTDGKYHRICVKKISDMMFGYYILCNNAKALLKRDNHEYFSEYSLSKKIYILLSCCINKTMKKYYLKTVQERERKKQASWENP